MKKLILFSLLILPQIIFTQEAFHKNTFAVTFAYGAPSLFKQEHLRKLKDYPIDEGNSYGSSVNYTSKGTGPFYLKLEYGITEKFGLGLLLGKVDAAATSTYYYYSYGNVRYPVQHTIPGSLITTQKRRSFCASALFNYHFGKLKKIDPYVSVAFGYANTVFEESGKKKSPGSSVESTTTPVFKETVSLYAGGSVGLKVYLTSFLGVNLEIGYDSWAAAQAGLVLNLPE